MFNIYMHNVLTNIVAVWTRLSWFVNRKRIDSNWWNIRSIVIFLVAHIFLTLNKCFLQFAIMLQLQRRNEMLHTIYLVTYCLCIEECCCSTLSLSGTARLISSFFNLIRFESDFDLEQVIIIIITISKSHTGQCGSAVLKPSLHSMSCFI